MCGRAWLGILGCICTGIVDSWEYSAGRMKIGNFNCTVGSNVNEMIRAASILAMDVEILCVNVPSINYVNAYLLISVSAERANAGLIYYIERHLCDGMAVDTKNPQSKTHGSKEQCCGSFLAM